MKKKTITLGIYPGRLTIIFSEDFKEVSKKYKLYDIEQYKAFAANSSKLNYMLVFSDKSDMGAIVHEITHLKNYVFSNLGIEADLHNDENEAYFMEYLFLKVKNVLDKF